MVLRASAVLLGCAALLCVVPGTVALDAKRDYALMIDAGSTGSRIRLYSWASRVFSTLPPPLSIPLQQEDFLYKVKPGIGEAAGRAALSHLLAEAKNDTQLVDDSARWGDIPIFLFATAGMRVLDSTAREAAFHDVRATLGASGFAFKPRQARVIAGEEEGVFGWLTVNELAGLLSNNASAPYLGALDMGGASTQITFAPTSSQLANLFHVGLETEVQVDVYTHSFLYFGLDKARWRLNQVVALNTTAGAGGARPHPCWLNNGTTPYALTVNGVGNNVPFTGAGDWDACLSYLDLLMNKGTECLTDALDTATLLPAGAGVPATGLPAGGRLPPINAGANSTCSVNGVYQPPVEDTTFLAFSGYTYLYQFFGLGSSATPADLAAAGRHFCGLSLSAGIAEHAGQDPDFVTTYCFTAAFVYSLWTTGYGFPPTTTHIQVVTGSDADSYSYAFGSMIFEANSMAWEYAAEQAKHPGWGTWGIAAIIAICVASIAVLVATLLACRTGACGGASNQPPAPSTKLGDAYSLQAPGSSLSGTDYSRGSAVAVARGGPASGF